MNAGVLYISYDGMLEPLGQSQVLAYLERLAPGRRIHLISFEKPADWANRTRRGAVEERIKSAGIRWHPLKYHRSPSAPATAYDVAVGSARAVAIARQHGVGIVHARSYVAGLMALAAKRMTGARLLFDMRGFWADERVEGGLWARDGALYRAAKKVERMLLLAADHVVTLTHAAQAELRRWPYLRGRDLPITVIRTCVDLERFIIAGPAQHTPFVLGYVGSASGWYLVDEMLRFFTVLREAVAGAKLLIVNRSEHEFLRKRLDAAGMGSDMVEVTAAEPFHVPAQIARMSAGLAFYTPGYARMACSPTKLGEYLACGVPCAANAGIGDVKDILESNDVGVSLRDLSNDEFKSAVGNLIRLAQDPLTQERCRASACKLYSLEGGVADYDRIYTTLGSLRGA